MIWKIIAFILARPAVANWLITQAQKTPYTHIYKNGKPYMERYWLFNPYYVGKADQEASKYPWFPWNIRLHWIRQTDQDKHMHDHPWNARTIILRGGYVEERQDIAALASGESGDKRFSIPRPAGSTARIRYGMYHRITHLQAGGAWTLFISGPYQGTWGFLVDGAKVQWRKYLGLEK